MAPPFFPLVGALVGVILGLLRLMAQPIAGEAFGAAVVVCGLAFLTRGMHLDGLADTLDALGSGRDREGMLQVMKDSPIGAFGALGISALLILKFSLLLPLGGWKPVVLFPCLGRAGLLIPMARLPYLRRKGMLSPFHPLQGDVALKGFLFTAALAVLLGGLKGLLALGLVIVFCLLFSHYLRKRIGGMTGDTLGATVEVAEVVALIGLNL